MKWKANQEGDKRVIKRFLLLPRCIKGEWRWLERARIKQVYRVSIESSFWESVCWAENEDGQ